MMSFAYHSVPGDSLPHQVFDFGAFAAGYEKRSTWLIQSKWSPQVQEGCWHRVEFVEDRDTHSGPSNLAQSFGKLLGGGPAPRNWDGTWRKRWRDAIKQAFLRKGAPIDLFVDISSMPRAVYGALVIESVALGQQYLRSLVLGYVPGEHQGDLTAHRQLEGLRSLVGVEGQSLYERGVAVILGLGYDGALAESLIDLLQVDAYSVLYASPSSSTEHVRRCELANVAVIQSADFAARAPIDDIRVTVDMLLKLKRWYVPYRDVLTIPIGPKPHVVAALLASIVDPDLGFRALRTSVARPVEVAPVESAPPVCIKLTWDLSPGSSP